MSSCQSYLPLSQEAGYENELTSKRIEPAAQRERYINSWATTLVILCSLLNIWIYWYAPARAGAPAQRLGTPLPRPNQYIGLDRINRAHRNFTIPEPIVTFSPILFQVRANYPERTATHYNTTYYVQEVGTITTADKRFLVNDVTTSIAQFRARDWGMESCQIILNLPPPTESSDSAALDFQELHIWKLAADKTRYLTPSTVSWKTKPARVGKTPMASMIIGKGGQHTTSHFTCRSGSVQTFEFSCGSQHCAFDFTQDGHTTAFGMYILQHSSL